MSRLARVAVVGRPNVGKSSLINRFVGRRVAIVEETPGLTRDRHEVLVERGLSRPFLAVDTGGWVPGAKGLSKKVAEQAERAVREADLVLFVVDVTVGLTEEDLVISQWLRRSRRQVVLVANKVDSSSRETDAEALVSAGFGEPWPVSAIHGRGVAELLEEVERRLGEAGDEALSLPKVPAVAIIGRPNVGKSSLFNLLVGDERSITHDLPGTTTDAIDTVVETDWGALRFIDTAGLRRKSRIEESAEYYSLVRALQALDAADVALLVLDAREGVTQQDRYLAERADASGSGLVLVANKSDLLRPEELRMLREELKERLSFVSYAPLLETSAKLGRGIDQIIPAVSSALEAAGRRISTSALNAALKEIQQLRPPPGARVLYGVQGSTMPPTITLFSTGYLEPSWIRYLERSIRERFGLGPTPIEIRIRRREDGRRSRR